LILQLPYTCWIDCIGSTNEDKVLPQDIA